MIANSSRFVGFSCAEAPREARELHRAPPSIYQDNSTNLRLCACAATTRLIMSTHEWGEFEPVGYFHGHIEDRAAVYEGRHIPIKQAPPAMLTPAETKVAQVCPGYAAWPVGTLMYFPLRARAEPLRLILHYSGPAYVMHRVDFTEWATVKPTMPNGQVPVWQTDGETELMPETADIAKHLAQISDKDGLMPTDAAEAAEASRLFELTMSPGPLSALNPLVNWTAKEEASKNIASSVADAVKVLKGLKPPSPYFGGAKPHYADFALWHSVDLLTLLDASVLSTLGEAFASWYAKIKEDRAVAAYIKSRPKAGTGKVGKMGSLIYATELDGKTK